MDNKYYVYIHKNVDTGDVFYVGKGCKAKSGIDRHSSDKYRNRYWKHYVEKYDGFDSEIIADNLSEEEAYNKERDLIKEIGLNNLCNFTSGGEGGDTLSNHPDIEIIGQKISERMSGSKNPNYDKGYHAWWVEKYGKDKADQMRDEMLDKRTNKWEGTRGLRSTGLFGDLNPSKRPEVRAKISELAKSRTRKRVVCEYCGFETVDTHIKQHQRGSKCKKNISNK